jgi:hypothetical protein
MVRDHVTPMTTVLDIAERRIGREVSLWWVDNGPATAFSLLEGDHAAVVFSSKCLEATSQSRWLYANQRLAPAQLEELAYRQALRRQAEEFLLVGNTDLAVIALAESILGQSIRAPYGTDWRLLEYERLDESYMALWFFGLAHELGHVAFNFNAAAAHAYDALLTHERLSEAVSLSLKEYQQYPEMIRAELMSKALAKEARSPLSLSTLREECFADMFACGVLLEASQMLLERYGKKAFDSAHFSYEMLVAGHLRHSSESIARFARMLNDPESGRAIALAGLAGPVAASVRTQFVRAGLEAAGREALADDLQGSGGAQRMFDTLIENMQTDADLLGGALERAMRFTMMMKAAGPLPEAFEAIKVQCKTKEGAFVKLDVQWFCELAESLGRKSVHIDRLLAAIRDEA